LLRFYSQQEEKLHRERLASLEAESKAQQEKAAKLSQAEKEALTKQQQEV